MVRKCAGVVRRPEGCVSECVCAWSVCNVGGMAG